MPILDELAQLAKETDDTIISLLGKDCYSVTKQSSDPKDDKCEQDSDRIVFYSEKHEVVASCEIDLIGNVEIPSLFIQIQNISREKWLEARSKRIK